MRNYQPFSYKGANFRISSDRFDAITREIVHQRWVLSEHINRQPEFLSSLVPVRFLPDVPDIVQRMYEASLKTGIGPMAAVAGVTAQIAAEFALNAGGKEAIVENGGDIYMVSQSDVVIGLYAGDHPLSGTLGLAISINDMPLALCSSSSRMGHSTSLGNCDLATVTAADAALADAAATLACNLVTSIDQIDPVMEKILNIPGIQGILIIKDDRIGLSGKLPPIVKHQDHRFTEKITKDKNSRG